MLMAVLGPAYADGPSFESRLSGAQSAVFDVDDNFVPGGTSSQAGGRVKVQFNEALSTAFIVLRVTNLTGSFQAAHLHCARPGQNGPVAFGLVGPGPLSFDGERLVGRLTNLDFNGADCEPVVGRPVNNIAALALAMRDGLIYANVHTDMFPAGEARAQLLPEGGSGN
jgi:hypothetical protein